MSGRGHGHGRWRSVLVCRGCCCGTDKHRHVPHAAHLAALQRAARRAGAICQVTGCLDRCDDSNVVVLRRTRGDGSVETVWLGRVLSTATVGLACSWLERGGDMPAGLRRHRLAGRHQGYEEPGPAAVAK